MSCKGGRVGFLQRVEKADLGGRLDLLGSDGKCVFVHGVECAREVRAGTARLEPFDDMLDSETFSPFINADIRTPYFSADVLFEVCAYRPALDGGRGKAWRGI